LYDVRLHGFGSSEIIFTIFIAWEGLTSCAVLSFLKVCIKRGSRRDAGVDMNTWTARRCVEIAEIRLEF